MLQGTTIDELHGRLLRDTFDRDLGDLDSFLIFVLFHNYQVELDGPFLTDRPGMHAGSRVFAETQRGCAEALASLWSGGEDERADDVHWYHRWNTDWDAYRHAEHLSDEEKARLRFLIAKLERHPFVRRFVPEDDDLLADSATS